jgi:hypothetical protein
MSNAYETCQGDKTLKLVMCYDDDDDDDEIYTCLDLNEMMKFCKKGKILLQQFCFMKYYFVIRWLQ